MEQEELQKYLGICFNKNTFVLPNIDQTYVDIFNHVLCQTLLATYWTALLPFLITKKSLMGLQILGDQVIQEKKHERWLVCAHDGNSIHLAHIWFGNGTVIDNEMWKEVCVGPF